MVLEIDLNWKSDFMNGVTLYSGNVFLLTSDHYSFWCNDKVS